MATKSYWDRIRRQRFTRRKMLAVTGASAAGLAIAAACGDSDDNGNGGPAPTGADTTSGSPRAGGRYIASINGDWGTIDPVTSVGFAPGIFPYIYNVLVDRSRLQPDFVYFDLAEKVEQPDEETYIFTIRPGVKIAPNSLGIEERDLDSGDAKAWFDRIAAEDSAVMRSFTGQWLDSVSAPDAMTFELKTAGPYAYTLFRIGAPLGGTIPPREFFEQDISLTDQGVGAGPWAVIEPGSYSNTGGIVLHRNPNYYRKADNDDPLPYMDTVESVRISDRQPRRAAFIDGQIDVYTAEDREEADGLLNENADFFVTETPANTFIAFTMNPTRDPWKDERIRKAALHALNRQQFVDLVVGEGGGRPNGLVHWPLGDFALSPEELEELQPYDPAESRKLIQAATGSDSIDINMIYPVSDIQFHDSHLPIFLQQMSDAGFNIKEDPQDFTTWLGSYTNVDYDSSLSLNQIYETAEVPLDFHAAGGPQGDENFAIGIGSIFPEVEEAINASKAATDPEAQIEAVLNAQRVIYEKGPAFLPIMSWVGFTMYQPFVKNIPEGLGATGLYLVSEIWLDKA